MKKHTGMIAASLMVMALATGCSQGGAEPSVAAPAQTTAAPTTAETEAQPQASEESKDSTGTFWVESMVPDQLGLKN